LRVPPVKSDFAHEPPPGRSVVISREVSVSDVAVPELNDVPAVVPRYGCILFVPPVGLAYSYSSVTAVMSTPSGMSPAANVIAPDSRVRVSFLVVVVNSASVPSFAFRPVAAFVHVPVIWVPLPDG
jgi:hypothetical protein